MLISPARLDEFTVNISGVDTGEGDERESISTSICKWECL